MAGVDHFCPGSRCASSLTSQSAWHDVDVGAGPLAGSFPLLSLRTNKADVVVGVDRQVAERLDQSGEKWRVSGR